MKDCIMRHTPRHSGGNLSPITLRIADACRITGIGRSKFYELIKAGEIEVIKVGAITLVPMSGIQALLERGRPATGGDAFGRRLRTVMHPFLANAILTGSIVGTPESVRRDLASRDLGTRTNAENSIIEQMIVALYHGESEISASA